MKKSIYTDKHKQLCELLIKARKDAHITQQELADKLDKPQSFVAKYEQGERRIDIIELIEIADHLKIDIHALIKKIN